MIKTILLDAGHGLPTAGRRTWPKFHPVVWQEWELNNRIAVKTEEFLKAYDVNIVRLDDRTGKRDVPLQERTAKANRYKDAYLLSMHHNASIRGGSGGGLVVFIANNAQTKSVFLAPKLYKTLIDNGGIVGNRYYTVLKRGFWMLRNHKHPSALVEYGFMDSSTDVPIIVREDFADNMAKGNVEFFEKHLGIKKKKTTVVKPEPKPKPVPTPTPVSTPKPNTKPAGRSYTSVVDYLKDHKIDSSYKNRAILAREAGIKNYRGEDFQNIQLLNVLQGDEPVSIPKPKKNKENLVVDGWWGDKTTRALQRALETPVDGVISGQHSNNTTRAIPSVSFTTRTGSLLVRALQTKVGANPDGYIGPETVIRLQRYLGTYRDGIISKPSAMVKEMQKRLNAGTF